MTDANATHGEPLAACLICGGTAFAAGPNGRMARSGQPPRCLGCRSLERHRIIRQVFDALPDELLSGARALQFSDDVAAPRERFASVEVSEYCGENSLDIMNVDRPDAGYDWVIANHVIEHVADHHKAVGELMRIAAPTGVVQLTVPTPSTALETWELDAPDPKAHGHYRGYGSDFPMVIAPGLGGARGLQVIGRDPSTSGWDVVYLFTRSRETMLTLGGAILRAGLPTLRCA